MAKTAKVSLFLRFFFYSSLMRAVYKRKYSAKYGYHQPISKMERDRRKCGHCGAPISGRADKRYCSDQCRAAAGNLRKHLDPAQQLMHRLNRVLGHNRQVLHRLSPQGKAVLRRDMLLLAGFDFRYFTHQHHTPTGNLYYFCYDYGYLLLPEEKILIVNGHHWLDKAA